MKYIIIVISLFLSGCAIDSNKQISKNAFDDMCNQYELYICGDKKPPIYTNSTIDDIQSYARDLFVANYIYKKDTQTESYDYMNGSPMEGDCDDVVITLLEDLISIGYIDNGQAVWKFGTINGERHSWLLITKESETYVFDTAQLLGVKYNETPHNYEEEFEVYRY